jgi:hypothetical protein
VTWISHLKWPVEKLLRLIADNYVTRENEKLAKRVEVLESTAAVQQEMEYREPYFYKHGDERPMCPKCWQQKERLAVFLGPAQSWSGGLRRICPVCNWGHYEKSPQAAIASANFERPRIMITRRSWPIFNNEFEP